MASAYLTMWTDLSNYEYLFNDHAKIFLNIANWLEEESLAISKVLYDSNEQYDKVVGSTFLYEETGEEADVYNKIQQYLSSENTIILPNFFQIELIPKANGNYREWLNENDILKEEYKANYNPNNLAYGRFVNPNTGIELTHLNTGISVLCNYERSRWANLDNAEPFLYSKVQYYQNT